MSKTHLVVEITNTDNAAFTDGNNGRYDELARIMQEAADKRLDQFVSGTDKSPTVGDSQVLHDLNGNTVGRMFISDQSARTPDPGQLVATIELPSIDAQYTLDDVFRRFAQSLDNESNTSLVRDENGRLIGALSFNPPLPALVLDDGHIGIAKAVASRSLLVLSDRDSLSSMADGDKRYVAILDDFAVGYGDTGRGVLCNAAGETGAEIDIDDHLVETIKSDELSSILKVAGGEIGLEDHELAFCDGPKFLVQTDGYYCLEDGDLFYGPRPYGFDSAEARVVAVGLRFGDLREEEAECDVEDITDASIDDVRELDAWLRAIEAPSRWLELIASQRQDVMSSPSF